MNIRLILTFILPLTFAPVAGALEGPGASSMPGSINYQGRVTVGSVNFTGTGQFKFALVDGGVNQSQAATATASVTGGQVTEIIRLQMGSGYTVAPLVTITGDGTGATATALLGLGSGTGTGPTDSVNTITINNAGSGYTSATVTIAPPPPSMIFTTFWSHDSTSVAGSEPASAVPLGVTNGLYGLALGDTSLVNMSTPIPAGAFDNPDVRLRVWFNDGTHGSQLLTPDQRFATVPYAFRAASAQTVPANSITSAQLADGAVLGNKLAAGAVTADRLNVTGAPNNGQVLGFDGANLTWLSPGGGGGGGGSFALPYSGLAASTGSLFSVNNSHATAQDAWAIYGHSQNSIGVFGQTHGNSAGVLGRAEGPAGQAVFGYSSNAATGLLGISEGGDGVIGIAKIGDHNGIVGRNDEPAAGPGAINFSGGSGVFGYASQDAVGVQGISEKGDGIFGRTNRANKNAIYGYSDQTNAVGVKGESTNGDGIVGITGKAGKSGLAGFASLPDNNAVAAINSAGTGVFAQTGGATAAAGFFWNTAGGDAIRATGHITSTGNITATGRTKTGVLEITGGMDVAEPFDTAGSDLPKGSVVAIDPAHPGKLRLAAADYDTCVAGVISGANGIHPGVSLSQSGVVENGQLVALTGRVYCRADATHGAIRPGDLLTTSATPGHAMKVNDHTRSQGAVLGKAMSVLDEGTGFVLVLVTLQ